MHDLISRQAAKDERISDDIKNAYYDGYDNGYNAGFEAGQRDLMLEKLPAAHPSFSQPHENDHSADDSKKAVQPEPCEDAVSRKAAIRWVKTECNPYGNPTLDFESGKKVIEHLEQMPSAQPEIIRCKDCKHKPSGSGVNHDISFPDEVCPCQCEDDYWYSWMPKDNWFCGSGERREDED